jgi:hypothetical protein
MKNLRDWFFNLLKNIGTQRRYQVSFGLWFLGLVMIIGANILEEQVIGSNLVRTLLLEIGIACIIAAIAEFVLLKHASELFLREVQKDIKILEEAGEVFQQEVRRDMQMLEQANEQFRQGVRRDMKILSHCLEHELEDIMPPRNEEQEGLAVKEINQAIEKARVEIRIIVFTLRDILSSRTSLDAPLRSLLDRDENVTVKLLLIDPTSEAARIRVMAEEGAGTEFMNSKLHLALLSNFYEIKGIMKSAESKNNFKIEALFYSILPSFYMVSTQNEVFFEPYHLGHKNNGDSTIGGIVPLFRFSAKSPMYAFANSHFSYIWGGNLNPSNGGTLSRNGNPFAGGARSENGNPSGRTQADNGFIRVKSMKDVELEIDRRLDRSERRSNTARVNAERRLAADRRNNGTPKVKSFVAMAAQS